eukprot:ANDGO_06139.mRNA.1 hypothetical protein
MMVTDDRDDDRDADWKKSVLRWKVIQTPAFQEKAKQMLFGPGGILENERSGMANAALVEKENEEQDKQVALRFWSLIKQDVMDIIRNEIFRYIEPMSKAFGLPPRLTFEVLADALQSYEAFADAVSITLRYYERDLRRSPYRLAEEVVNTFFKSAHVSPMLYQYLTASVDGGSGGGEGNLLDISGLIPAGSDGPASLLFQLPLFQRVEDQIKTLVRRFLDILAGAVNNLKARGYHIFPAIRFADDDDDGTVDDDETARMVPEDICALDQQIDNQSTFLRYLSWLISNESQATLVSRAADAPALPSLKVPEVVLQRLPPFIRALAQSELFMHFLGPDGRPTSSSTAVGLGYSIRLALFRDPATATDRRQKLLTQLDNRRLRSAEALAFWNANKGNAAFLELVRGLCALGSVGVVVTNENGLFQRLRTISQIAYEKASLQRPIVPTRTPFLKWIFSIPFRRRVASHATLRASEQSRCLLKEVRDELIPLAMSRLDFESRLAAFDDFQVPECKDTADGVRSFLQYCQAQDVPVSIISPLESHHRRPSRSLDDSSSPHASISQRDDVTDWATNFQSFYQLFASCEAPEFLFLWNATDASSSEKERMQVVFSWVTGNSASSNTESPVDAPHDQTKLFKKLVRKCSDDDLRHIKVWCEMLLSDNESSVPAERLERLRRFCESLLDARSQLREDPVAPYNYARSAKMKAKYDQKTASLYQFRSKFLKHYDINEDSLNLELQKMKKSLDEDHEASLEDVASCAVLEKVRFVVAFDELLKKEGLEAWYDERQADFEKDAEDYIEEIDVLNKMSHLRMYNIFGIRNGDKLSSAKDDSEDSGDESEESSDSDNEMLELQDPVKYSRTWLPQRVRISIEQEVLAVSRTEEIWNANLDVSGRKKRVLFSAHGNQPGSDDDDSDGLAGSKNRKIGSVLKPWEKARTQKVPGSSSSPWLSYSSSTFRSASRVKLQKRASEQLPFRMSNRRFTALDELRDVSARVKSLEKLRRRQARMVIREADTPYHLLQDAMQEERLLEYRKMEDDNLLGDMMSEWDDHRIKMRKADAIGMPMKRSASAHRTGSGESDDDDDEEADDDGE